MDVEAVERELCGPWSVSGDESTIVATHDSGVEIQLIDDDLDDRIVENVIQPVSIDEFRIDPITDSSLYPDSRHALAGISKRSKLIDCGEQLIAPIAYVPHTGDPNSVEPAVSVDMDRLPEALASAQFCDIVFVRPQQLPDPVAVEDIRDVAEEIVAVVYGQHDGEYPDVFEQLESENLAYGQATIEVTTVTEDDISRSTSHSESNSESTNDE